MVPVIQSVAAASLSKQEDLNSKNDGLQGNTGTRCAQTSVFLILSASIAGPADRFARKSFATAAGRGRSVANLQRCGYLYTRHP